jgi:hypothetical protein
VTFPKNTAMEIGIGRRREEPAGAVHGPQRLEDLSPAVCTGADPGDTLVFTRYANLSDAVCAYLPNSSSLTSSQPASAFFQPSGAAFQILTKREAMSGPNRALSLSTDFMARIAATKNSGITRGNNRGTPS